MTCVADVIRRAKEVCSPEDMKPLVIVEVAGKVVAVYQVREYSKNAALAALGTAYQVMKPCRITIAFDAHGRLCESPEELDKMSPGYLNRLAKQQAGIKEGLVFETIVTIAADDGQIVTSTMPYVSESGNKITWTDPVPGMEPSEVQPDGFLVDTARRVIALKADPPDWVAKDSPEKKAMYLGKVLQRLGVLDTVYP